MELPQITTYKAGQPKPANSFYVLNKGENAGRPMHEPCANCFTVKCANPCDAQYWYYLSLGLWQAKEFYPYIGGSVIPFIRLADYSGVICRAARKTIDNPAQVQKAITAMQGIDALIEASNKKLKLLSELKVALLRKHLCGPGSGL